MGGQWSFLLSRIMFLTAMKLLERLTELKYMFTGLTYRGHFTDYLKKLIRALPISSSSQMEHSMKCVFITEHHYLIMEIAYHPEPNLNNGNRTENVLHVHEYPQQDNFCGYALLIELQSSEYEKYKKFFKGAPEN